MSALIQLKADASDVLKKLNQIKRVVMDINDPGRVRAHAKALGTVLSAHDRILARIKQEIALQQRQLGNLQKQSRLTNQLGAAQTKSLNIQKQQTAAAERQIRALTRGGGMGGSSLLAGGLSRLGGTFPNSAIGYATRQAVTGGLVAGGAGQLAGNFTRMVGGGLASSLARTGTGLGRGLGFGVAGAAGAAGMALPIVGAYQGAKMGTTIALSMKAFEGSVAVFKGAVSALAGVAARIAGVGLGAVRMGVGAAAGLTVGGITAGVAAESSRQRAVTGLRTLAGPGAGGLMQYAHGLADNSMFGRTQLTEGVTKGLAFNMSPAMIRSFLPKVMDASALFGSDPAEGLRALARAAFQAEPEAAEASLGLNLYEKNIRQRVVTKPGIDDVKRMLRRQSGGRLQGDRLDDMAQQYRNNSPGFDLNNPTDKAIATLQVAAEQLSRFAGIQSNLKNTLPGSFTYVKNKFTEFLENIGGGFSSGFNLPGRARGLGDALVQRQGLAGAFGQKIGSLAGAGVDWVQKRLPSVEQVGQFFTTKDEGTTASQWGDTVKGAVASVIGVFRTVKDIVSEIWEMLSGENSLWDRMIEKAKSLDWKSVMLGLVDAAGWAIGQIETMVDQVAGNLVKTLASKALESNAVIGGATGAGVGTAVGAILGGLIAGPPGAAAGAWIGGVSGTGVGAAIGNSFANGGVVGGGQEGQAVPAVVHVGEMVLNRKQQKDVFGKAVRNFAAGTLGGTYEESPNYTHSTSRSGRTVPQQIREGRGPSPSIIDRIDLMQRWGQGHLNQGGREIVSGAISRRPMSVGGESQKAIEKTFRSTGNALIEKIDKWQTEWRADSKNQKKIETVKGEIEKRKESTKTHSEDARSMVNDLFDMIAAPAGAGASPTGGRRAPMDYAGFTPSGMTPMAQMAGQDPFNVGNWEKMTQVQSAWHEASKGGMASLMDFNKNQNPLLNMNPLQSDEYQVQNGIRYAQLEAQIQSGRETKQVDDAGNVVNPNATPLENPIDLHMRQNRKRKLHVYGKSRDAYGWAVAAGKAQDAGGPSIVVSHGNFAASQDQKVRYARTRSASPGAYDQ